MDSLIDARGKACPTPVILAKQSISAGAAAFTVLVDNETAVENLKRLADNQGYSAAVRPWEGALALDFSRAGEEAPSAPAPPAGDWAVLAARDVLGEGDRALGSNLMRMYFYTLAQSDDPPGAVLFLNSGVKLPTLDEQVCAHLADLAARGTDILVCGTCLNFYGLSEQLKVGAVSNMYDIAARMGRAGKVVSL